MSDLGDMLKEMDVEIKVHPAKGSLPSALVSGGGFGVLVFDGPREIDWKSTVKVDSNLKTGEVVIKSGGKETRFVNVGVRKEDACSNPGTLEFGSKDIIDAANYALLASLNLGSRELMRKSYEEEPAKILGHSESVPCWLAASREILATVPSAQRIDCPDCDGLMRIPPDAEVGIKVEGGPLCGTCSGFGYIFSVSCEIDLGLMRQIEGKHGVVGWLRSIGARSVDVVGYVEEVSLLKLEELRKQRSEW